MPRTTLPPWGFVWRTSDTDEALRQERGGGAFACALDVAQLAPASVSSPSGEAMEPYKGLIVTEREETGPGPEHAHTRQTSVRMVVTIGINLQQAAFEGEANPKAG